MFILARGFKKVWLCLSILAVAGCGATQLTSGVPPSFVLQPKEKIELLSIENVTGKPLPFPADQVFNQEMAKLLRERDLISIPPHESASVTLRPKLVEYEEGNAFSRWLLPGYGTTICTVHAELLDRKTGAVVGEMRSRQSVSFGGAYSMGAYEYICKRVAEDLIGEIDKKVGK